MHYKPYKGRRNGDTYILAAAIIFTIICTLMQQHYAAMVNTEPSAMPTAVPYIAVREHELPIMTLPHITDSLTPPPEAEPIAESRPTFTPLGEMQIYGYDPYCKHCTRRGDGITASGVPATIERTAAMYGYSFGTKIYIEGLGYFVVEDRGVGEGVVDLAMENHTACYAITGRYNVWIVERGMETYE